MSRGGLRWGRAHISVESCHSFSAEMRFVGARADGDDGIEGDHQIVDGFLVLEHKRDGAAYWTRIQLTETHCHFGGSRRWLICPGCGRRVGKVFLPTNVCQGPEQHRERVQRWRCRHCYRLTYEQRRSKNLSWVLTWRAESLLEQKGIMADAKGCYRKPKGMRWKTFELVTDKANALFSAGNAYANDAIIQFLKNVDRRRGTQLPTST